MRPATSCWTTWIAHRQRGDEGAGRRRRDLPPGRRAALRDHARGRATGWSRSSTARATAIDAHVSACISASATSTAARTTAATTSTCSLRSTGPGATRSTSSSPTASCADRADPRDRWRVPDRDRRGRREILLRRDAAAGRRRSAARSATCRGRAHRGHARLRLQPLPRHIAFRKMCAMVEGAALVRRDLAATAR